MQSLYHLSDAHLVVLAHHPSGSQKSSLILIGAQEVNTADKQDVPIFLLMNMKGKPSLQLTCNVFKQKRFYF